MGGLIQSDTLSHGTVECSDMVTTRRFLTDFLGLDIHRPFREAQYMYRGGPWTVVCVHVDGGEAKQQTPDNRFKLAVDSADEVDAAHAAATEHRDLYGIQQVEPVREEAGRRYFWLQDLNHSWWEITNIDQSHYEALFEAGDVTVGDAAPAMA